MTDLLARPTVAPARTETVLPVADAPEPAGTSHRALSAPARTALALLSGAAGLIHLVMVPDHMALSGVDGVMFAVAGWTQIGLAVVLAARPGRAVLGGAVAVNAVFVAVWAVSRVWGLPIGSHAGEAEPAAFVDLTAVGLEVALIVAAAWLLWRPATAQGWTSSHHVVASVVPLAVVALTTTALVAPSTRSHAHGTGSGEQVLAGDGHAHAHGEQEGDDLGFSLLGNGHQHESGEVALDDETQAALDRELAATRALAERYPTLADAEAAGYTEAGPYSPGLGLHLMPPVGKMALGSDGRYDTPGELESPFLIYDGIEPTARIAGFMYFAFGVTGEPEGFAGPNDHWHFHTDVCVVYTEGKIEAPLGADRSATQEQCDRFGGTLIRNTGYMVHVWSVPGYENPDGTFAELTPALTCPDGTYHTVDEEEIGFSRTLCRV